MLCPSTTRTVLSVDTSPVEKSGSTLLGAIQLPMERDARPRGRGQDRALVRGQDVARKLRADFEGRQTALVAPGAINCAPPHTKDDHKSSIGKRSVLAGCQEGEPTRRERVR